MNLRDYQTNAINKTVSALQSNHNVILTAPTGSGKTVMGVEIVKRLLATQPGMVVLWIAHRKELIFQARETLEDSGLKTGVVMADYPMTPNAEVQVASIQTLIRRPKIDAKLIVVDEAHHCRGQSYAGILKAFNVPKLGLTATPFRLDGKGLGEFFNEIIVAATPRELIQEGYLTEPVVYAPMTPDMTGVAVRTGDFMVSASSNIMRRPEMIENSLKYFQKYAKGRRSVIFTVDVAHSLAITDAYNAAGNIVMHLDANTHKDTRAEILYDLKSGIIDAVTNCMILTEGWDLPQLEVAQILRPTASLCLHLQMIGRIMRAADQKSGALVLDHAGNHHRHGFVTNDMKYSLTGVQPSSSGGTAPVKECSECHMVAHLGTKECPECGYEFESNEAQINAAQIEALKHLEPISPTDLDRMQKCWNKLVNQRDKWGFKHLWVFKRFHELFNMTPVVVGDKIVDPLTADTTSKASFYNTLLLMAKDSRYDYGWAYHMYLAATGGKPQLTWAPLNIRNEILRKFRKKRR